MTDPSPVAPNAAPTSSTPPTNPSAKTSPAAKKAVFGRRTSPWRWISRVLAGLIGFVLVLGVTATALTVWSVRRAFPQLGGELSLPGLSAPVTVYRDQYGIPQLYARTAEDLFRAQGYVHAQDRFWEMDFRRHVTAGRLSELFGAGQVETDAYLRTLGWRRVAEQEWAIVSPETKRYLQAYADGVNAWLDQTPDNGDKSLEYTILGLTTSGYRVEPWSPVDTIAWLKAMAWDLRGNMTEETDRALLLASGLSRAQVEQLYPAYPYDNKRQIIPQDPNPLPPTDPGDDPGVPTEGLTAAAPLLSGISKGIAALPDLLGDGSKGIGSNSWVVSGQYTTTGKPLLANDPHLSSSMPGIWYQIGLHCECAVNVEGFSFSGVPGVVIGHTDRIAWGFTNLGPDVTDLYLEKIDGDKYFDGTSWRPLTTRTEEIKVAGGDPVVITVRSTPHGPLLSDRSQDLLGVAAAPAAAPSLDPTAPGVPEAAAPYGVALRWTALDPGHTIEALFAINQSTDWDSFRAAATLFEVPAQNLVYADIDGNIGYQSPGKIPVRGAGDGTWPAPGWDPSYDWTGYLPFDELPSVLNPDEGFIVTANQAVVGSWYPHLLTQDWSYGYRAQRIGDLLTTRLASGKIDASAIREMEFDNRNDFAPTVVAALRGLSGLPAEADLLFDWDYQQGEDSAAAALYNAFWRNLLLRTFDELPDQRGIDAGDRWFVVMDALLDDPTSAWWDATSTDAHEDRSDVLAAALTDAVAELRSRLGDDPASWRWGDLHTITLTNATFGSSGIAPIEWLFNRGPFPTSGGSDIVNATGWDPLAGYAVTTIPSMRMIVDLSNLDASRWVQLTGNSGHAFHRNYDDQFPLWRVGENLPMRWDRASIEAATTDTLVLRP